MDCLVKLIVLNTDYQNIKQELGELFINWLTTPRVHTVSNFQI